MEIPEHEAATWLLESFRYCLGRQTYATGSCVESLHDHWQILPRGWQEQIQGDIREAIEKNRAGADMDISEWEKVLELKIK